MSMTASDIYIPKQRRGLGLLLAIKRDPLRYFTTLMNQEGDYAWLKIDGRPLLMLNDATGIEHVLQKNSAAYGKGHFHKVLKPLFGDSMFLNEGPAWRQRREEAAPVFASGNFDEILHQMIGAADTMFVRWDQDIAKGKPIDATIEMTRFALDALLRALFHQSQDNVAEDMRSALGTILRDAEDRLWASMTVPEMIAYNLPKYRSAQRFLKKIVNELIEARRADKAYPEDLLSRFVEGFGSSPREQKLLYDEVLSFVLAGHDTTAHALAWAMHTLALHTDIHKNIQDEVALVLGNKTPDMESIKKLAYTWQVVHEILRLYPPVWTMSREAAVDDRIPLDDGNHVDVPAGAAVMMCHYAVHRREKYWSNPEAFDPARFSPDAVAARPKFAWFPFGGGPRTCLGLRFAVVESVLMLALMAQKYTFSLVPGQKVVPEPIITLRPSTSIFCRFKIRDGFHKSAPAKTDTAIPAAKAAPAGKCPFHFKASSKG